MNVLPATVLGLAASHKSRDRRVIVTDPDLGDVPVRWQLGRPEPWRCSACGPMAEADCAHTFAAGIALAEALLGLARVEHLNPTEGVTHQ